MNISYPFIRRPIGTTLLALGLFLVGIVAYRFLPVASLPAIDLPTIRVTASRPGADPSVMAATVAAPIERRLGEIAGVTEMTSTSSLGFTTIAVQFDLKRSIEGAARDVQAALNAAATDLPSDLPMLPTFRKSNPAAAPVLILALTSRSISASDIYDAADTVLVQRISQVEGVADVLVSGADQPAIRVRVDSARLAAMGLSLDQVRAAIVGSSVTGPVGALDGDRQSHVISTNGQLDKPSDYDPIVVRMTDGTIVRLSSVATINRSVRNALSTASFNGQPAVLLFITKQADANVIETVDSVLGILPEVRRWLPADIDVSILSDRTQTIRASVHEMQMTLAATIGLVMMVVFLFLRRLTPTLAAGVTVPLALAGTTAAMWLIGFSIDNLSLMALAISVGFVVDDAIVMIENVYRRLEAGCSPLRAAIEGSRQVGFTVVSISVSLVAAFIPLLFMGGIVGRLFREFSVTLAIAIAVSTIVSLTVTPMICANMIRAIPSARATLFDRIVEGTLGATTRFYAATLAIALRHWIVMLLVFLATIGVTVDLYIKTPKGYFPQDDSGLIVGFTQASNDVSYQMMSRLQQRATDIVLADPAVAGVGSSVGGSAFGGSASTGRMFISLKPLEERGLDTVRVIARLRAKLTAVAGLRVFMTPAQDLRVGARQGRSQYQYTLWDSDIDELTRVVPQVLERLQKVPGLVDVATDREANGFQANVVIDRAAAARLGVKIQDIDNALNNSFSQRQIASIYTQRNQYRVVLEVDQEFLGDPAVLSRVYVAGAQGTQVPLSSVARFERSTAPLVVNHQGQFPSVTITYNLTPETKLDDALAAIEKAIAELHLPAGIRAESAGDARSFTQSASAQTLLIVAALLAVYIVLGVLYESLAHPLTIISTLPSAGLGALLALQITDSELSIIAFIGIILLIGIVKKNGIMMVDFALQAERQDGLAPLDAIKRACIARFRPILMTTLAALLGAIPLVIASGPGAELRRPLGITIVGGLLISQILTLYSTPVIYLLLDRLHRRLGGRRQPGHAGAATRPVPAE
jgi:hydrophobe/amphiphile efflux-1 (HAE1) family protein